MKTLWAALLALVFSFPAAAGPTDTLLAVRALSTVSYNANLGIWNEHNVTGPQSILVDFSSIPNLADDISVIYDLTVAVSPKTK
jgi:hypothetical protein